jgi:hypothetical protein
MWNSLPVGGRAVEVGDLDAGRGDQHDLVLAQLDRFAGVLDERGHSLARKSPVAAAHHERRVAPGGDHRVGHSTSTASRVKAPSSRRTVRRIASASSCGPRGSASRSARTSAASRWAAHSVSVSLVNSTRSPRARAQAGEVSR